MSATVRTPLIAVERRAVLLPAYTAATILAGVAVLVLVTLFGSIAAPIALPMAGEVLARPAGIVLWTLFGLAGSLRVLRGPSGHGVLTFHLPFIVAAMVLGGPIAGGWVAFLSSVERRELDGEVPWYGALANHAGFALAAVAGGLAAATTTDAAAIAGRSRRPGDDARRCGRGDARVHRRLHRPRGRRRRPA